MKKFLKNKKEINIISFEKNSDSFLNIEPASSFIPEWYRKSPSSFNNISNLDIRSPSVTTSTYKKCTPFYDAMTAGYIVYLTADIEVIKKEDGLPYIMWRTDRKIITEHSLEQWQGLTAPEGYSAYVYKWHNQHIFKTTPGYSLLFLSPINRDDLPFKNITGIVDTDLYNLPVHFPFFIKDSFTGIIKSGTPICQIIPIKRESWNRRFTEYNENFSKVSLDKYFSTIKRSYKNNSWIKKDYR